jgi:hypothetical protein
LGSPAASLFMSGSDDDFDYSADVINDQLLLKPDIPEK